MIKLNLLPPSEKKALILEQIQRWIIFYVSALVGILLVFATLLGVSWAFINIQLKSATASLEAIQTSFRGRDLTEQQALINLLNADLEKINSLQVNQVNYSQFLTSLTSLIPPGIFLTSLSLNEKGEITMNGYAQRREQVIELKDALEESELFINLDSPLSNLVKPTDIIFYFKFTLKPELLKP